MKNVKKEELFDIWKVYYMTYEEIESQGEKQRELVYRKLTFQQAREKVEQLGFGYSIHPHLYE